MDHCPTEIWNHIFALACTDNGFTGRSLSLTSRYIRETSKSVKLQSLSLTEPEQIINLARLLADTEPKHRRIRYLFVASSHAMYDRERVGAGQGSSISAATGRRGTARSRADECWKSFMEAFLNIVREVSPTITILHVHLRLWDTPLFPTSISFPSLIELTLYGPCLDHDSSSTQIHAERITGSPSFSECPPTFPSLRRLRLADGCRGCLGRIASVAPSLTHLSLSSRGYIVHTLLIVLGIRPDSLSNSYGAVETLPLTVKMVLIDPGPAPIISSCGNALKQHGQHIRYLQAIAREDTRIYVLEARPSEIGDAEGYWQDRIEGGDGTWTVTQCAP